MNTPRTPADRLAALLDNRQVPDHAKLDVTMGELRALRDYVRAGVRVEDEGGHGDIDERSLAHRSVYGDQVHIAIAWPNGERWEGERVWSERMVAFAAPDERSRAIEARARHLAGDNHAHGAIPAKFWREAIEEAAPTLDRERLARALDVVDPQALTFGDHQPTAFREAVDAIADAYEAPDA